MEEPESLLPLPDMVETVVTIGSQHPKVYESNNGSSRCVSYTTVPLLPVSLDGARGGTKVVAATVRDGGNGLSNSHTDTSTIYNNNTKNGRLQRYSVLVASYSLPYNCNRAIHRLPCCSAGLRLLTVRNGRKGQRDEFGAWENSHLMQ